MKNLSMEDKVLFFIFYHINSNYKEKSGQYII